MKELLFKFGNALTSTNSKVEKIIAWCFFIAIIYVVGLFVYRVFIQ